MAFVGRGGRERLAAAEVLAAHLGKNVGFESVLPLSVHTRCIRHCQEQARRQFTQSVLRLLVFRSRDCPVTALLINRAVIRWELP